MNIKVICKKCDHMFNWNIDNTEDKCPYCYSMLTMRDIRMTPLEYKKYLQYIKTHRTPYARENAEERKEPQAAAPSQQAEQPASNDDVKGKFVIRKGRTKYGTIEMTDPDYMILKLSFWAMGPQQKYIVRQLNEKVRAFLKETGFDIEK